MCTCDLLLLDQQFLELYLFQLSLKVPSSHLGRDIFLDFAGNIFVYELFLKARGHKGDQSNTKTGSRAKNSEVF